MLLQYYKVLPQYYSVLQTTTPVLLRATKYYVVLQTTTPVLLRTTKYYVVLQNTTPYYKVLLHYKALLRPLKRRQNDVLPVLLRTTPVLQERPKRAFRARLPQIFKHKLPKRAFRARLPQLFKQQASKTSISCETSATFQARSFPNGRFVRGFRNFSSNKLPKRAFRARLPQLFKQGASKALRLPRKTRK